MRATPALAVALLLGLATPTVSGAALKPWTGTLRIDGFFVTGIDLVGIGSGISNVNGSAGGSHLNTLALSGGISASATISLTDPDLPTISSIRMNATLGSGTFAPISGAPPLTQNALPVQGVMKVCILFPGCANYVAVPLTAGGSNGMGIGGIFTINTFSGGDGFKASILGAPWTIGLASIASVTTQTANGGFGVVTRTAQGFAHGPASATSATAGASGVVQLVAPIRIITSLSAPNAASGLFATLTIHFVPEPSTLLLAGAGIGILALGRRRRAR